MRFYLVRDSRRLFLTPGVSDCFGPKSDELWLGKLQDPARICPFTVRSLGTKCA
jgi:hypothetical protein